MTESQRLFDDPPPDNRQIIEELYRELKMRRQVYPRQIEKGALTQAQASYRIRCLKEAIGRLEAQQQMLDVGKVLGEDAERYLWLRELDGGRAVCRLAYREEAACTFGYDQPDEAVDAARAAQKQRGGEDA